MRGSILAAFLGGFAAGMAVLAGALWIEGGLRLPATAAAAGGVPHAPPPPVDTSMPDLSSAPKPPLVVLPPVDLPQTLTPSGGKGEAARSMPETDKPMVPGSVARRTPEYFLR
jgi:hypothetical protein